MSETRINPLHMGFQVVRSCAMCSTCPSLLQMFKPESGQWSTEPLATLPSSHSLSRLPGSWAISPWCCTRSQQNCNCYSYPMYVLRPTLQYPGPALSYYPNSEEHKHPSAWHFPHVDFDQLLIASSANFHLGSFLPSSQGFNSDGTRDF